MKNNYKVIDDYVEIYMSNYDGSKNFITYIDLNKLEKVLKYNVMWYPHWQKDVQNYYAVATEYLGVANDGPINRHLILARIIMNCFGNERVDHTNHNTLDNREYNLRVTDDKNNLRNRKSRNKNNTTGYRNVSWMHGWLRIQLQINGKNHLFPERFKDVKEAALFAEEMRLKYYGEYAGKG